MTMCMARATEFHPRPRCLRHRTQPTQLRGATEGGGISVRTRSSCVSYQSAQKLFKRQLRPAKAPREMPPETNTAKKHRSNLGSWPKARTFKPASRSWRRLRPQGVAAQRARNVVKPFRNMRKCWPGWMRVYDQSLYQVATWGHPATPRRRSKTGPGLQVPHPPPHPLDPVNA